MSPGIPFMSMAVCLCRLLSDIFKLLIFNKYMFFSLPPFQTGPDGKQLEQLRRFH